MAARNLGRSEFWSRYLSHPRKIYSDSRTGALPINLVQTGGQYTKWSLETFLRKNFGAMTLVTREKFTAKVEQAHYMLD